jgi:hypothetical protein
LPLGPLPRRYFWVRADVQAVEQHAAPTNKEPQSATS